MTVTERNTDLPDWAADFGDAVFLWAEAVWANGTSDERRRAGLLADSGRSRDIEGIYMLVRARIDFGPSAVPDLAGVAVEYRADQAYGRLVPSTRALELAETVGDQLRVARERYEQSPLGRRPQSEWRHREVKIVVLSAPPVADLVPSPFTIPGEAVVIRDHLGRVDVYVPVAP